MKHIIIRTAVSFLLFIPIMLVSVVCVAAAEEGNTSINETGLLVSTAVFDVFRFPLLTLVDYFGHHISSWPEFFSYMAIDILLWAFFCNVVAELVFRQLNKRKSVPGL